MNKAIALFAAVAAFSSAAAYAAQDGNDRHVEVQNRSSQAIHYLYASPVTADDWEEDLLGSGTIEAGATAIANVDNGTAQCDYDLKVVMANGQEHIRRRVNVCAVSRLVVTNSGTSAE